MSHPIRLTVHGAAGRMGARVIAMAAGDPEVQIVAALERSDHPRLGEDAGTIAGIPPIGIQLQSEWPPHTDVVIDFSLPEAAYECVRHCQRRRFPLVLATTGLNPAQVQLVKLAAEDIPIVWSPSMSPAVNLVFRLAQQTAAALRGIPGGVDVEIIERHHRHKIDAPSGTAIRFGQLIAAELGESIDHQHGRHGETGARPRHQIGYHAVRGGDDVGQHTILFLMQGERVELHVAASSRDAYANGAVLAAKWLVGQPPDCYSMAQVLDLQ
jgi:4-hydroxy-tetrahydrodipicolinate reductase